jgi:hypothetical protein
VNTSPINCGVPQGSPCSPVLSLSHWQGPLEDLPEGVSYVIDFVKAAEFQEKASGLLTKVKNKLAEFGFKMDETKTEVAWIYASSTPRAPSKTMAA